MDGEAARIHVLDRRNVEVRRRAFQQNARGLAQHAPTTERDEHGDRAGKHGIGAGQPPKQDGQRGQDRPRLGAAQLDRCPVHPHLQRAQQADVKRVGHGKSAA